LELPRIENISPAQFKIYLDNADLLESWLAAIKSQAFSSMARGIIIDGYELTEGLGNREWRDAKEVEKMYGGTVEIYDRKLKSPAQLEKLVSKKELEPFTKRESTGKKITKTTKQAPDLFDAFNVIGD
jgi:hypothetical protein